MLLLCVVLLLLLLLLLLSVHSFHVFSVSLMSIPSLTFSVFLIKLSLKLSFPHLTLSDLLNMCLSIPVHEALRRLVGYALP
jgi:hypothetical protein